MFYRSSRRLRIAASLIVAASVPATPNAFADEDEDIETVIVQATRTGRRVDDQPLRVEIINREEIEEKILMTPGNISTLVSETPGVRVQVTSPSLGAANIRMLGMPGRYTQLLADGLPIFGGQTASLGLLQIPPTDVGRVEVIKGAASALYGSSALGGVINLVSRKPGATREAELLLNGTTHDGQDITGYVSGPLSSAWGYSLTAGFNRQSATDLDADGFIDAAAYQRYTARPRFFWGGDNGATAFITLGATSENRKAGTLPGSFMPDGTTFPLAQKTERFDAGFVGSLPIENLGLAQFRAAAVHQDHRHQFGSTIENDNHGTYLAEASLSGKLNSTDWLAGLAIQHDGFRSSTFPGFNYGYTVPALFLQLEHDLSDEIKLAGSLRADFHNVYGTHLNPRLSVLYKPGAWNIRASVGRGFFAPTPFVDEIENAGLSRLQPMGKLKAETAETASIDVGYKTGPFETGFTLFASHVHDAAELETISNGLGGIPPSVSLVNASGMTETFGTELLLRYRWEEFTVTGSYVYIDSVERGGGIRPQQVERIPRHTAGLVAIWEEHGKGRLGFEAYCTGPQRLENNPYRTNSRPYLEMGVLAEVVLGNVRLFLNAENILDVRQTDYDRLVLPARAPDGRWTVDAWAPTDGFVLNGGLRFKFGEED